MEKRPRAEDVIAALGLEPLVPEGGWFRSTYRSGLCVDGRSAGSAIYYLLAEGEYSHLHCLDADEIYHFYAGNPVELFVIHPNGAAELTVLGAELSLGQRPQCLVPAGCWQGACLSGGKGWALLGTSMSPGYEAAGYRHAQRDELLKHFPQHAEKIKRLTQG